MSVGPWKPMTLIKLEQFNTRSTFRYMDDKAFLDNVHFLTMFYIFTHTTSRTDQLDECTDHTDHVSNDIDQTKSTQASL